MIIYKDLPKYSCQSQTNFMKKCSLLLSWIEILFQTTHLQSKYTRLKQLHFEARKNQHWCDNPSFMSKHALFGSFLKLNTFNIL